MTDSPGTMATGTPGFFHPASRPYRFIVLLFASLLPLGSYFAYDSIGAISTILVEQLGISRAAIGNLYTVYSIAAIGTLLVGGILIDVLGTRKASLLFSSLVVLGAAIVALSDTAPVQAIGAMILGPGQEHRATYWAMVAGRFLFGAGSESMIVAQSSIFARWFKGKELALAFGIGLTVSRIGTLFTFNTEALIAKEFGGYRAALWAAVFLCLASLAANVVYVILDRRGERILALKEEGVEEKIRLADIGAFPRSYWYVTLLCVTFYSAIFPFTALSTDFFHEKWGLPLAVESGGGFFAQAFGNFLHMFSTAPGTTSIIIFASMVFAPFAGSLVDRIGRRATLMVFGSLLMIPSYLLMAYTHVPPTIPMILLGAAFVLVPAAMWPSVALVVDEKRVGTAYGLMTMIQNIGLALFPYLNGKLRDVTHDYTASMLMFASLGVVGLVFALLLRIADAREGGRLERPSAT